MNPLNLFTIALSSLRDRKLRTVLTTLGILIGPATIVTLLSITEGFNTSVSQQFEKLGITTIVVMPGRFGTTLTTTDAQKLQKIENVRLVAPYYQSQVTLAGGTYPVVATNLVELSSLFPGFTMLEGELPGPDDLTGCVIGYNLAFPSDPTVAPIGMNQVIQASRQVRQFNRVRTIVRSFLVKGIANKFGAGLLVNIDNSVMISLKAGQLLTGSTSLSGIFVVADQVQNVNTVSAEIPTLIANVNVLTVDQIISTVQSIIGSISVLLVAIASMSVFVAFFGIMTTMFTAVTERTREIGLLKALGYNNRMVMLIFLSEATLMGFIGGIIGTSLGSGLSFVILELLRQGFSSTGTSPGGTPTRGAPTTSPFGGGGGATGISSFNISPVISPELIGGAVLMAMAVATLAGLLPSWRASRLTPMEALRHE